MIHYLSYTCFFRRQREKREERRGTNVFLEHVGATVPRPCVKGPRAKEKELDFPTEGFVNKYGFIKVRGAVLEKLGWKMTGPRFALTLDVQNGILILKKKGALISIFFAARAAFLFSCACVFSITSVTNHIRHRPGKRKYYKNRDMIKAKS